MSSVQSEFAKACSAIMVFAASAMLPITASSMRAVVTEAGADSTGRADSTPAIQKCIDRVSAAGGGTVFVPPGVYRILYLSLRPYVRLELAGGAERATDGWTPVIVETARACEFKDEAEFRAKVKATELSVTPSALDYTGIYGSRFHMLLDRDYGSTIDGELYVKKIGWSVKSPFVRMPWCGDAAELTFGSSTIRLDFSDNLDGQSLTAGGIAEIEAEAVR